MTSDRLAAAGWTGDEPPPSAWLIAERHAIDMALDAAMELRRLEGDAAAQGDGRTALAYSKARRLLLDALFRPDTETQDVDRPRVAVRWSALAGEVPVMADAGLELLYQHGPGLGYLATVRSDGGVRVHPVCPTVLGDGLYVSLGRSPKRADLARRARYALHTFPRPEVDDEFFVAGSAIPVDPATEAAVHAGLAERGVRETGTERVFELLLERALWAKYGPRPSWPPAYTRWQAQAQTS